jgi:AraC-like DNA-binding protein
METAPDSRQIRSTTDVGADEASDYWTDMICDSIVKVSARPSSPRGFSGRIEHFTVDQLRFSMVASQAQQVYRTDKMIGKGDDEYAMIIQITGHSTMIQDDRAAVMAPGTMTFLDHARPCGLHYKDSFSHLVVNIPRQVLPHRILPDATAVTIAADGPGRLISDFLLGMERQHRRDPETVSVLAPHAIGLVTSALSFAGRTRPTEQATAELTRERVHRFIRQHAADPALDADTIAAACGMSRRSLFRALSQSGEVTLTSLVREIRVDNMRRALRDTPFRSLGILAHECGFAGEAQMYRAFRHITGTTPAAYRDTIRPLSHHRPAVPDRQTGLHRPEEAAGAARYGDRLGIRASSTAPPDPLRSGRSRRARLAALGAVRLLRRRRGLL